MKALLAYIDAVNSRDFEKMEAVFDEALEHRILPKSLERPVLTKRLYGEYWRGVMSLFESFEVRISVSAVGLGRMECSDVDRLLF